MMAFFDALYEVLRLGLRNMRGYLHGFEFVLVRDNQRQAIRRLCTSDW